MGELPLVETNGRPVHLFCCSLVKGGRGRGRDISNMACPACTSLYIDTADEWGKNQRQIIIVVDVEESSLKLFLAGKPCIFATVFNISIVAIYNLYRSNHVGWK